VLHDGRRIECRSHRRLEVVAGAGHFLLRPHLMRVLDALVP
jgi:hypothetical protein